MQILYLARNGVPWSEVMAMSSRRRLACCVTLGEIDGGQFDWSTMNWAVPPG